MYDENTKWVNQQLLKYKDEQYNTNGYLRLSWTCSITGNNVSVPSIGISISDINRLTHMSSLDYMKCNDLVNTLRPIIHNPEPEFDKPDNQLIRKTGKTALIFDFLRDSNTSEKIVRLTVFINDSDFCKIVIPYEVFVAISKLIKDFTEKYVQISRDLYNSAVFEHIQETSEAILKTMRELPSMLGNFSPDVINVQGNVEEYKEEKEGNLESELDSFIGGEEMSRIDVPEIDNIEKKEEIKETKIVQITDNKFINDLLDNDILTIEKRLNVFAVSNSPFTSFLDWINSKIDMDLLPGISDTDKKSILYISKVVYSVPFKDYLDNGIIIPNKSEVMKYNPIGEKPENIDLAYDLLLITAYLKLVRERIETVNSDAVENRSALSLLMRCISDPLVFSFLDGKDKGSVVNIITSKYNQYNSAGFFNSYKQILNEFNCKEIIEMDITNFIGVICDRIIDKQDYIEKLHNNFYKVDLVSVPYENEFNIEQILNEISMLDIERNSSIEIFNTILDDTEKVSDDVRKVMVKRRSMIDQNKVQNKVKDESQNNLIRFINNHKSEIPTSIEDKFKEEVKDFLDNKIKMSDIPLELLGDDIVKALYNWEPGSDPKVLSNYKHFCDLVEKEIMTKDLIITNLKTKVEGSDDSVENDWSFVV